METLGFIVDCVTLAFVTYAFVILYEISNRLEEKTKPFDKLYERSSCPPKKKSKISSLKRFIIQRRGKQQKKS